ncbi:MAG: hypothetical protein J0L97_10750 [Alphaproteobacteria bacterium]|nr:hypothetical protein [Alphaproteobacteria bacterium]
MTTFLFHKSGRNFEYGVLALIIVGVPAAVFAGMYYLFLYMLPLMSSEVGHTIYYAALIFLGLAVPYFSLKLGMHYAHLRNREQKKLKLKDIPKDQEPIRKVMR